MVHKSIHISFTDLKAYEALKWFTSWYNEGIKELDNGRPITIQQIVTNIASDFAEINIYKIMEEKNYYWSTDTNEWVKKFE